ncbi:MAG: DUF262 domain-containing protein, partial [Pseudomonadota bacterium]
GGLTLNNQEIRNAMAKKPERDFLQKIAQHPLMPKLMGGLSKRMLDQELVLRFWAFYYLDYSNEKFSKFLDHAMEKFKQSDHQKRDQFESIFDQAISRCDHLLGETAFQKKTEKTGVRYKNRSLFEVWMVSLARLDQSVFDKLLRHKADVREAVNQLLQDPDFYESISHSTQNKNRVHTRHAKVDTLIKQFTHA